MGTDHDFNQIYADYFPRIHRYLTRFAGPFQAEDLAQEVFNKVHKGLPKLGATARLSAWIYRIATNTAIDRTRTREFKTEIKTGTLEDLDPGRPGPDKLTAKQPGNAIMQGMPDQKVIKAEMNACIEEYIEALPYDYKTVLILSQYEHLKNREIAEILNVSLDTVKIRLHRARTKLKKALDAGCDFYLDEENILSCDRKQK